MADLVLRRGIELRRRALRVRGQKDRVVTEPAAAPGLERDAPFPRAMRNDRLRVVVPTHERDHAVVARLAKLERNIVQLREELVEIVRIAGALARESR